jgi:hypothetical protein
MQQAWHKKYQEVLEAIVILNNNKFLDLPPFFTRLSWNYLVKKIHIWLNFLKIPLFVNWLNS